MSMNFNLFSNVFKYKLPKIEEETNFVYKEYLPKNIF